jgi:hypothetical protein
MACPEPVGLTTYSHLRRSLYKKAKNQGGDGNVAPASSKVPSACDLLGELSGEPARAAGPVGAGGGGARRQTGKHAPWVLAGTALSHQK